MASYTSAPTVGLGGGYNDPFNIPGGGSGGGIDWGSVLGIGGNLLLGGLGAYQNQQSLNNQNAMTKEQLAEHKREFDIQNAYRSNPQFKQYMAFLGKRFGVPDSAFAPSSAPSTPGATGTGADPNQPYVPGAPSDPHHGVPYQNPVNRPTNGGTATSGPGQAPWYRPQPKSASSLMRSQFGLA